ncbi:MAG: restriction endonuclease subunit S [Oscillospiraceae bacterium]
MEKVRLGDIAILINGDRGKNYPSQADITEDGDVPFVNAGHLNGIDIDFTEMNYISQAKYDSLNSGKFQYGDILYCLRGSLGKKAKVNTTIFGAVASSLVIIRSDPQKVNSDYLMFALDSPSIKEQLIKANNGSSQPNLSAASVRQYCIELPELELQDKIVKKLTKLRSIIAHRKQQLAKLDELVKARFVEMFGDFKTNPKGWRIVHFTEIASIDGNMTTEFEKYADYPHIGIDSIEKETGRLVGYRTVSEDNVVSGKYLFTPQHLIYSKIRPNLNKVALPSFHGVCSADAYPILPKEGKCNRVFLAHVMQSKFFLDYILQFCSRTNLPKVNRKEVSGFSTPLPPLELQQQFAAFVEQTDKSKFITEIILSTIRRVRFYDQF